MVAQDHRLASVKASSGATAVVTKKDAQEAGIGLNKIRSGNLTSEEKSLLSDAMALRRGTEQSFSAPKKPTSGKSSSFKELSKKVGAQEARRRETEAIQRQNIKEAKEQKRRSSFKGFSEDTDGRRSTPNPSGRIAELRRNRNLRNAAENEAEVAANRMFDSIGL